MRATIVIHSRVRSLIGDGTSMEWHCVTASGQPGHAKIDAREIDRAEAHEIIKTLGLVEAHSEADGEIYDTREGAFKALFPRGLTYYKHQRLHGLGL